MWQIYTIEYYSALKKNRIMLFAATWVERKKESEVAQLCPTLCDPMDCSLSGFSVHGILHGKNTGVGYHFLLQRIFPAQGWNPGLLQILYHLSYRKSSSCLIPLYSYYYIITKCLHLWGPICILTHQKNTFLLQRTYSECTLLKE